MDTATTTGCGRPDCCAAPVAVSASIRRQALFLYGLPLIALVLCAAIASAAGAGDASVALVAVLALAIGARLAHRLARP